MLTPSQSGIEVTVHLLGASRSMIVTIPASHPTRWVVPFDQINCFTSWSGPVLMSNVALKEVSWVMFSG